MFLETLAQQIGLEGADDRRGNEGLGGKHYMGSPHVDDEELARFDIDRVYDTYADDMAFQKLDESRNHILGGGGLLPEWAAASAAAV